MKILMVTPYVTITSMPEFSRNKTGFGYMVMDIAKAVGKLEAVDILATDTRGKAFDYEGVHFLNRSIVHFITSSHSCLSLFLFIELIKEYSMGCSLHIRMAYYWLMTGYLKRLIKKGNYDIVHIHGCGLSTELWMQVCKNSGQKFVVTLHGLNSFSDSVKLEPAGKKYERDFLMRVTDGEIPITVISTGMKRLIEKTYKTQDSKNITVVCNSFNFEEEKGSGIDVRKRYGIPQNAKVLLYVGNISKNKNQVQMVKGYGLLKKELRNNTWVLFCGEDHSMDGELKHLIETIPEREHLVLCGGVDKNEMKFYYKAADGVVLLSYAEGFGLSLIEGMHFGVPCALPRDLDAFEDIYDERAVVAVKSRSNVDVAKAVEEFLTRSWDKDAIKAYSKKFESKEMAREYIVVYQTIFER